MEDNGLQTLTEIEKVLDKKKIVPEDLTPLTMDERKAMEKKINDNLNSLSGDALDAYLEKIEKIVPGKTDLRHQQWEIHHSEISRVLHNYIIENSRPPTKNEISKETGLSRQTIAKHLKEFNNSDFYKEERAKFKMLSHRVLSRLYVIAREGNTRAARLYFEMTGELGNQRVKNNTYIQINNVRVTNELIKQLPIQSIQEIEAIILSNLPNQQTTKTNGNT